MPAGAIVVGDIVHAMYKSSGLVVGSEFLVRSMHNGKVERVMNMDYYDRIPEVEWLSYTSYVLDMSGLDWVFVRKSDEDEDVSGHHYKVIRKIKLLQLKRKEKGYVF